MSMLGGTAVRLRALDDDDVALVARWLAAETVVHSSRGPRFLTPSQAREVIGGTRQTTLVVEHAHGDPIGALSWRRAGVTGGYTIEHVVGDPERWGADAGREAFALLFGYLFRTLNAHRVELVTATFDRMMIETVAALGLTVEGVLRDYFYLDGRFHHAVVSSLLATEYAASPGRHPSAEAVPAEDRRAARRVLSRYLAAAPVDVARRLVGEPADD